MPHQCTACGHAFEDGSKEMLSGCPDCGGNKFQFRPAGDDDDLAAPSDATATTTDAPDEPEPPTPPSETTSVAETVGRATTKVRDLVASDPDPPDGDPNADAEWPGEWETTPTASGGDDDIIDADARRKARATTDAEDTAQASARSDVVSPSELETGTDLADGDAQAADESPATSEATLDADASAAPDDTDASTAPDAPVDGDIVGEPTDEDPDLTELREQLNDQFESIKILEPGQYELNLMELYDREEYIIALQENGRYVIQVPEQWIGEDPDDR